MFNATYVEGGRREEGNSTIKKAAKTGGSGGARISCNAKNRV